MLAEVVQGGLPRVGLAQRGHRHSRQHAGRLARLLHRELDGERIHDGGQHADRIGAGALDAGIGTLDAAKEVAAADHHGDLDAEPGGVSEVQRDLVQRARIEPVAAGALQRLARQLDDDALPVRVRSAVRHAILVRRATA